jgi:hypothetical protein
MEEEMTIEEFDKLFVTMCEEERDLLMRKGIEYSGKEDRLANFKKLANDLGLNPKQVLFVYLTKHLDSIRSYIKNGKVMSNESIEGRIADARNYLALLRGLIEEK